MAVLAASLAPGPGNHVQPIGGILGVPGLIYSIWIGWYAHCVPMSPALGRQPMNTSPIEDAKARIQLRDTCRQLLLKDPRLAFELAIGRPDLPRHFDGGGLVDVNRASEAALMSAPGIGADLAKQIVAVRNDIGRFTSADDLEVTLHLPPASLESAQDLMIF